jgi:hypothetical protein
LPTDPRGKFRTDIDSAQSSNELKSLNLFPFLYSLAISLMYFDSDTILYYSTCTRHTQA